MIPNNKIFCNSPWYELHIYWDGTLGFCCHESHKIYPKSRESEYNIKNMSIRQWMDSEPMRVARSKMFGNDPISFCSRCYNEEAVSNSSRRHRSNLKSVIFTRDNFRESYQQSPSWQKFEYSRTNSGHYDGTPIDLHIDLGNYCNLSCKMCEPRASSKIAAQYVKWGVKGAGQYVGLDWTRDSILWNRVLTELSRIQNLKNVHFMGGETLITDRFVNFLDFMLSADRTDLNLSFVTNGTIFDDTVIEKLAKFQKVNIEVSIETITPHNEYQRQGTNNQIVLANIGRYQKICDGDRITLTMRPAISTLTVGNYHTLLDFCLARGIIIKSLMCTYPQYLDVRILPRKIKDLYLERYLEFSVRHDLEGVDVHHDYNESDPNQLRKIIKNQVFQVVNLLHSDAPHDADEQLKHMVSWCQKWDLIYGLNARKLYPEFKNLLDSHGYQT